MRGNSLAPRPRLCAPDPLCYAQRGADAHLPLPRDALLATAGCFDRIPAARVTECPSDVTCHRCRGYLRRTPQYVAYLADRIGVYAAQTAVASRTPPELLAERAALIAGAEDPRALVGEAIDGAFSIDGAIVVTRAARALVGEACPECAYERITTDSLAVQAARYHLHECDQQGRGQE